MYPVEYVELFNSLCGMCVCMYEAVYDTYEADRLIDCGIWANMGILVGSTEFDEKIIRIWWQHGIIIGFMM